VKFIRLIIWKELLQIKADPLMARLIIFPVFIQLFVVGYALTTEVKHTPLAVVDRSATPLSASLARDLRANDLFDYYGTVTDERDLRRLMDRGRIVLGVVIPADFACRIDRPGGAPIGVMIDGQDANSSSVAAGYLGAIISRWTFRYLGRRLEARGLDINSLIPVTVSPVVLFNPLLKSSWYMVPALVVLLVTIITSLLTGFSIVKERERGTFEQLMVTPIQPIHVVAGKLIPVALIGLAEICVVLLLATLWFRIPLRGSLVTLFAFAILYMGSSLGLGIFTSTIGTTTQQVLFLTFFLAIFFVLLSGFFIPVENMPDWVQMVTYVNPVRFFMHVVREIFLKGAGFAELWREAAVLLAIGTVMFGFSVALFNRRMG
jgi:ABC-2 type transport system permease protein